MRWLHTSTRAYSCIFAPAERARIRAFSYLRNCVLPTRQKARPTLQLRAQLVSREAWSLSCRIGGNAGACLVLASGAWNSKGQRPAIARKGPAGSHAEAWAGRAAGLPESVAVVCQRLEGGLWQRLQVLAHP